MNRLLLLVIIIIAGSLAVSLPLFSNQVADAKTLKKIQFTKTFTSMNDPGVGHENEQMALILPPDSGSIYYGTFTYSSSQPIQIEILHQIGKSDSKGQPIWTVDNKTIFAQTMIDSNSNSGSMDFTGSALALHSSNSTEFTVTVSFDGWIRITNPEAIQSTPLILTENYTIKIPNAVTQIHIPMHKGLFSGKPVYYIITDSSNKLDANKITEKQLWKVHEDPNLAHISSSYGNIYIFTNGIAGTGTRGFQDDVFAVTPKYKEYSPLNKVVQVTWNIGREPQLLNTTQEILDANMTGRLYLTVTDTILNTPQITWPSGSMTVRDNKTLSDQNSYVGGQVLDINKDNMTVTFVGHRGWGPDGKTIYYIITAGTPQGPTDMMKVPYATSLSQLESYSRDLYHFSNGFQGAGPFGYQESVTSLVSGEQEYTPICKISIVTWNDPKNSKVLQTINDINYENSSNEISIKEAKVLNDKFIVDCPIVDNP